MSYADLKEQLCDVAFTTATPYSEDGNDVLYDEYKENLAAIADAGAELYIPCGNTGEYHALTNEERVEVVRATCEAVGDEGTVIGGVSESAKTAVSQAERYLEAGADGIMVMPPSHTYVHEQGLAEYYHRIADSLDCGIVLYKRGPETTAEIVAELSQKENVVGVKYAINDIAAFSCAVESCPGDVVWINGIAERFAPAFALEGAEGFTTGIGNFAPEATLALRDAIREENWEQARSIRAAIRPFEDLRAESGENNQFAAANNVPAVKYGMNLAGLYGGPIRTPLVELSEVDKERADEYYKELQSVAD